MSSEARLRPYRLMGLGGTFGASLRCTQHQLKGINYLIRHGTMAIGIASALARAKGKEQKLTVPP